jgi:phosphotransferase system  glucose/maltose/N-acetylglucosamine-specific IIC component
MEDFLKFRKMITPAIIQVLFWIGVAVCVIAGLVFMAYSFDSYSGGVGVFLSGLLVLILGPIGVRVYCELLILFFRMNESLTEIKDSLAKK